MRSLRALIDARGAHPARTVVLVPYAQLMPLAAKAWAAEVPAGFAPRFETTMNWAGAGGFAPAGDDLGFDMGRDLLTAHSLLQRAGLQQQAELLSGRLVEAAWQLGGVAAAVPPAQRADWAAQARPLVSAGFDGPVLALEAAVARIAIEWAAASAYATDSLLQQDLASTLDLLVVLEGLQAEPVADTLRQLAGDKAVSLPLDVPAPPGAVTLHCAADPADEAEQAAACVMRQIDAGRVPVALAATDRVLTRQIRAMLDARGVAIRDETGWKLSTTRAAAHLMAALRACAWNASSDAVLDWLKNCPALPASAVLALERRVRRAGVRDWSALREADLGDSRTLHDLAARIAQWQQQLQGSRSLPKWLSALRELLQATGQWTLLEGDAAGDKLVAALRLSQVAQGEFEQLPQAARRLDLAGFSAWVNDTLEAASFVPESRRKEEVVILPFNQLLARPFAALVLPGCDEVRLPVSPEPPGQWTPAQREALAMPSRESLEQAVRAGWRCALQAPFCDVLWRASDDSGETLLPSALVLALQLEAQMLEGSDPREQRTLQAAPTEPPHANGAALPVAEISASAYEDLRRCPYRFFALRQLGLKEQDELDAEIDKRDFGNWLHAVLAAFHETLRDSPEPAGTGRTGLMDICADEVTREMRLEDGEFLPFAAAWPQVRDGYLAWLEQHEASGAGFASSESSHRVPLGPLTLVGRIDRIDVLADGTRLVVDYKTEALDKSKRRVAVPGEDTQLAFYGALLEDDRLEAAYLNVGERSGTARVGHDGVTQTRDELIAGLLQDMERIGRGEPMAALGEGTACDFCNARGLCRRDFWK
ncbi:PD-(D/E)XK nuclease family protein [Caenimonas terrae]|uniref:PD-(D/E)XK nuclease family protein n=1 Tax=Caenimonas terrae TaxID=696074 RepID=A0ABW0NEY8_9BURK